ncbi:hypothetical protein AGMMS49543_03290 [Betaproteobacteria bacterium]|nr:hypothetical protein AGMMS49543_03290 [Betaproteobacteria bacterium]
MGPRLPSNKVLAHLDVNTSTTAKPYLDASLRSGQVKTDFGGHFVNGTTLHSAYNAKSTYLSAHVGAGYVLKLSEQSKLNLHAQYLWSHQDGDTVKLTTGETVKFKDVASQRTRLGTKWDYALTPTTTAWLGAAWEHEYDGKAKASILYPHAIKLAQKYRTCWCRGGVGCFVAGLRPRSRLRACAK